LIPRKRPISLSKNTSKIFFLRSSSKTKKHFLESTPSALHQRDIQIIDESTLHKQKENPIKADDNTHKRNVNIEINDVKGVGGEIIPETKKLNKKIKVFPAIKETSKLKGEDNSNSFDSSTEDRLNQQLLEDTRNHNSSNFESKEIKGEEEKEERVNEENDDEGLYDPKQTKRKYKKDNNFEIIEKT